MYANYELYVRVSTDKQSESVANQTNGLRQIAERRGWKVVEIYTDEGISGAKGRDKRPALVAMLNDQAAGSSTLCWRGSSIAWGDP